MTPSPILGLRGRTASPRKDEGPNWSKNRGEPSRRIWVSTSLEISEIRVRPAIDNQSDYRVHIQLMERSVGQSGETPDSGSSPIVLSVPVMGKEISLVTGLLNRTIGLSGEVPEKRWSYDQLQENYSELKEQYEELIFQLEEAKSFLSGPDRRKEIE